MRLVTFLHGGALRLGVRDGDRVIDLASCDPRPDFADAVAFLAGGSDARAAAEAACAAPPAEAVRALTELDLAAPILPSTVLCSGSNYRAHNAEKANSPLSGKEPEFFIKTSDCVVGPGAGIVHDPALTEKLDCETELAVVIGRPGRHIAVEDAPAHIFGYTVANDVTARDRQVRQTANGTVFYELGRGKAFDSSLPLGPEIVTADEIGDPQDLALRTWINGELRQSARTSDMIWNCAELVHFFSVNFTLRPGMLILTGTPAGTAWSVDAELGGRWSPAPGLVAATRYCLPGDEIVNEIEGVGQLRNRIVAAD
jgi:2-keto-4-pentenoate hydratase/2-oxohepta-3-ene-1,7-dioic acid hydratase in catechol pathway